MVLDHVVKECEIEKSNKNIFIRERNNLMIDWEHEEDAFCEGSFKSKFFRNDENDDEIAYVVEGEGDWGESIGFVTGIRRRHLLMG
ncbi:MAG: hypothetical protein HDQ99_08655 [Lachnospiraceae bacterium]|nr:hypothetical protein [Lachnospiraceae bacterium]